MLRVLDSAQRAKNVSGAVAEIGVHHGKFFIGLQLLQNAADECSVAIDVFGDQDLNVDQSGRGDLAIFRKNLQRWSSADSVTIHQGDSTKLNATALRELAHGPIRMFSVDGGHTESIVLSDMNLAEATLVSGGIVIADDVFNEQWPEVMVGTLRYVDQGGQLVPFAVGFNKVFFSMPEYAESYRNALTVYFKTKLLVAEKIAAIAEHEVVVISRKPRNRFKEWYIYNH